MREAGEECREANARFKPFSWHSDKVKTLAADHTILIDSSLVITQNKPKKKKEEEKKKRGLLQIKQGVSLKHILNRFI